MLIVGLQNPRGETHYLACAFPSACGKTNLAMLIPPDSLPGWRAFTVGDDIAWLHPGDDGRLWAINPEAGYFGVVPGTNPETNRNAYEMIRRDTLFTNVALTADNQPWWEGLATGKPVLDWQGRPYDPARGPAAHPNSRFTVSARRNPGYSPHAEDARGVPISALCSAAGAARSRRSSTSARLEARVLVGASLASETTAAAVGQVGVTRRDPMAMQPFCGYNFGDYWQHWLDIGAKLARAPRIYHVNCSGATRTASSCGRATARTCGCSPGCWSAAPARRARPNRPSAGCAARGSGHPRAQRGRGRARALLTVDAALWRKELAEMREYLGRYGSRLPAALVAELESTEQRLA